MKSWAAPAQQFSSSVEQRSTQHHDQLDCSSNRPGDIFAGQRSRRNSESGRHRKRPIKPGRARLGRLDLRRRRRLDQPSRSRRSHPGIASRPAKARRAVLPDHRRPDSAIHLRRDSAQIFRGIFPGKRGNPGERRIGQRASSPNSRKRPKSASERSRYKPPPQRFSSVFFASLAALA
jgi:hypothetical protein